MKQGVCTCPEWEAWKAVPPPPDPGCVHHGDQRSDGLIRDCSIEHPDWVLSRWRRFKKRMCHRTNHRAPVWAVKRDDGWTWLICERCGHAYTDEVIR